MGGLAGGVDSTSHVASYVVSGIGFIGGGVILKEGFSIRGLNTAATLWCTAAIGTITALGHECRTMAERRIFSVAIIPKAAITRKSAVTILSMRSKGPVALFRARVAIGTISTIRVSQGTQAGKTLTRLSNTASKKTTAKIASMTGQRDSIAQRNCKTPACCCERATFNLAGTQRRSSNKSFHPTVRTNSSVR